MGAEHVLRSGLDKIRTRYLDLEAGWPRSSDGAATQSLAHGDVVVMDVEMSNDSDAMASGRVGACRIVVVSAHGDGDHLAGRAEDGIEISLGIGSLPGEPASRAVESAAPLPAPRGRSRLSSREREVLKDVAAGMSNKEIARRLGLSEKTIKNHLSRAFAKLKACNRTEAVMRAVRIGMLDM